MKFNRTNYNEDRAEELTERLLENPRSPQEGVLTNDLLREFHRGYPLDNLRPFLLSQNQDLAAIGAWIASELGEPGKPLLSHVSALLVHPDRRVRFSAIDCVLLWAGASDGDHLALATKLIDDSEPSVRWKAMDFLSRVSPEQVQAALLYLQAHEPNSANIQGLRWLLSPDATNPQPIVSALQSRDSLVRRYGVVAARRISKANKDPLLYASSLDDPDVRDFAESSVALL